MISCGVNYDWREVWIELDPAALRAHFEVPAVSGAVIHPPPGVRREAMTHRAINLNTGRIGNVEPHYYAGVGLPDGEVYLDSLTEQQAAESLPQIIQALDARIARLERTPEHFRPPIACRNE